MVPIICAFSMPDRDEEKQQLLLQDLMDHLGFNSLVLQAPARIYGSDGGLSVVHSTSILPMHE